MTHPFGPFLLAHPQPVGADPAVPSEPPFPGVASKLSAPLPRPGSVVRTALLERLAAQRVASVVAFVAPAGYGKTTLLSQWAERDPRPFTWLTLDDSDNDPTVLLTGLALALQRVVPVDEDVIAMLAAPRRSAAGVLFRLLSALDELTDPAVLVLDDVHRVNHVECRDMLTLVIEQLPQGWQVAVGSRDDPWLPVARWRVEGRVSEFGLADLAMDDEEAGALLRSADVALPSAELAEINRWVEGWPAALYLEALAITSGGRSIATDRPGRDRFLVDYLHSEVLDELPGWMIEFLTRTSLIERLSGPLCDAVLDADGSAELLAWLERRNLLVIPVDHDRRWYRYHHVFRSLLVAELRRREPDRVPQLRRRAADWFEANGLPELAIDQAMELGDAARVARIAADSTQAFYHQGRIATVVRWFEWLDQHDVAERHPHAAVLGAWLHTLTGHPGAAERWADAAQARLNTISDDETDADKEVRGRFLLLRALMCRRGLDHAWEDAQAARAVLPVGSPWRPAELLLSGTISVLAGRHDSGDTILQRAVERAEDIGATVAASLALAERALLALRRGDHHEHHQLVAHASRIISDARLDESPTTAVVHAVAGRSYLAAGDVAQARIVLSKAQRLRPDLTHAMPFYAVQARVELARAYLALTDVAGARTVLREADDILRKRPHLGELADDVVALQGQLDTLRAEMVGASALTTAELRLLPLLSTHLSFREIGSRLFISPNTVKTEAISIYRKLGVSSRGDAVERAQSLGLLSA